jgi:hypothetical protein
LFFFRDVILTINVRRGAGNFFVEECNTAKLRIIFFPTFSLDEKVGKPACRQAGNQGKTMLLPAL